jgi:hypothetical protein
MLRRISLCSRAQHMLDLRGDGAPPPPVEDLQHWSCTNTHYALSHGMEIC